MKDFFENLISIINDKQKKQITTVIGINLIIDVIIIVLNIAFTISTTNKALFNVLSVIMGLYNIISVLLIIKICNIKIIKNENKEKTYIKNKTIGYGILDSNIKKTKAEEEKTIKINPLLLEFMLKGELILTKQTLYAELFELNQKQIIRIEQYNNDIYFILNDPNVIKHTQNYDNILSSNFEAYTSENLYCFENLFLSKLIFPKDNVISAKEIERNFEVGFYTSRSKDGEDAFNKMLLYVAQKQKLVSEDNLVKAYPIVLGVNIFFGLFAVAIGTMFNPFCIIAYIINLLATIILLFNLKKHYITFSKVVVQAIASYINSIISKTIDNALSIPEFLNILVISNNVSIEQIYEKYRALISTSGNINTNIIPFETYIQNLLKEEQEQKEKAKEKKTKKMEQNNQVTNNNEQESMQNIERLNNQDLNNNIVEDKYQKELEELTNLDSIGTEDELNNIQDMSFKDQIAMMQKEKIMQNNTADKLNEKVTQVIKLNSTKKEENPYTQMFSNVEPQIQGRPNYLGKNPFVEQDKQIENAGFSNNSTTINSILSNAVSNNPSEASNNANYNLNNNNQSNVDNNINNQNSFNADVNNINQNNIIQKNEVDKRNNTFDWEDETYVNENGDTVIKGHSVDVYGTGGYEAIRLDSTIMRGQQYKAKEDKQEQKRQATIERERELEENEKIFGIFKKKKKKKKKNKEETKKELKENKHFEFETKDTGAYFHEDGSDEVVHLNSTAKSDDIGDTVTQKEKKSGEIDFNEFMEAINKHFN